MRFLVRFCGVDFMHGVDATEAVISSGRTRCQNEGLGSSIQFTHADVCTNGLPDSEADFIWGEDAWCYVVDKAKLITEASRLVKPGGTIAFTDWVEGAFEMSKEEANRFLTFMKFQNVITLDEYCELLKSNNCEIVSAEDTGQFAHYCELYINMLDKQLTYDALKIIGFDTSLLEMLAGEMMFMLELAKTGKIAQGRIVAHKRQ